MSPPPPNMDIKKFYKQKLKKTILKAFDSKKQSKDHEYDETEAIHPTVFALNLDENGQNKMGQTGYKPSKKIIKVPHFFYNQDLAGEQNPYKTHRDNFQN